VFSKTTSGSCLSENQKALKRRFAKVANLKETIFQFSMSGWLAGSFGVFPLQECIIADTKTQRVFIAAVQRSPLFLV